MSPDVFISYRREDSSGHAGRLFDALSKELGSRHVFIDVDSIEPGSDFVDAIGSAVGRCDVFVSIIGPRWTGPEGGGRSRLEDPNDVVRLELEAALDQGIRVIPVLVQGASIPTSTELPETLHPLLRRNAMSLMDERWATDVSRLVRTITHPQQGRDARGIGGVPRRRLPAMLVGGGIAAAILAAVVVASTWGASGEPPQGPEGGATDRGGGMTPSTIAFGVGGDVWLVDAAGGQPEPFVADATSPVVESATRSVAYFDTSTSRQTGMDSVLRLLIEGEKPSAPVGPTSTSFIFSGRVAFDDSPALSPVSDAVAYVTIEEGPASPFQLVVAGRPRLVDQAIAYEAPKGCWIWSPTFSPDGRSVAFVQSCMPDGDTVPSSIMIVDLDGQSGGLLYESLVAVADLDWSPDGQTILFTRFDMANGNGDIWSLPLSGGGTAAPVIQSDLDERSPAWAPSGDRFVFISNSGGSRDLYVAAPDGTVEHRLTETPQDECCADW